MNTDIKQDKTDLANAKDSSTSCQSPTGSTPLNALKLEIVDTADPRMPILRDVNHIPGSHGISISVRREIAEQIVTAVNSHAALYEAARRLLRAYESDVEQVPTMDVKTSWETNSQAVDQLRAALSLVEGSK